MRGLEIIETQANSSGIHDWHQEKEDFLSAYPMKDLRSVLEDAIKSAHLSGVYLAPPLTPKKNVRMRAVARILDGGIGYLYLPPLEGDLAVEKQFYRSLGPLFIRMARRPLAGWIIDARDASGYLSQEMLSTVTALMGKQTKRLYLCSGELRTIIPFSPSMNAPLRPNMPVAVLHGPQTRMAGEALVMLLSTNTNVRTFGQATQGMPYVLKEYPLGAGHTLLLKEASLQLEGGAGGLQPDAPMIDDEGSQDNVLQAAISWILPQEKESSEDAAKDSEQK